MSGVLQSRPGEGFSSAVSNFEADHPEFRVMASGISDETPLKLDHQKHLRPDLPGPDNTRAQLECSGCHRISSDGNYFEPINYETDCQACHPIGFDSRILQEAPHAAPVYVDAFVRTAFSKYAGRNPGEWREDPDWHPAKTMAALERMLEDAPRDLPEWLERQVVAAEKWTFEERCAECHQLQQAEEALPSITDPAIPGRWFVHSKFSHQTHRALTCTACHPQVPGSSETSDVLLPNRELCLSCHVSSVGAPDTCVTCHAFHDRSQAEPPGSLTPAEILRR